MNLSVSPVSVSRVSARLGKTEEPKKLISKSPISAAASSSSKKSTKSKNKGPSFFARVKQGWQNFLKNLRELFTGKPKPKKKVKPKQEAKAEEEETGSTGWGGGGWSGGTSSVKKKKPVELSEKTKKTYPSGILGQLYRTIGAVGRGAGIINDAANSPKLSEQAAAIDNLVDAEAAFCEEPGSQEKRTKYAQALAAVYRTEGEEQAAQYSEGKDVEPPGYMVSKSASGEGEDSVNPALPIAEALADLETELQEAFVGYERSANELVATLPATDSNSPVVPEEQPSVATETDSDNS